jgi:asparagine synthase (glutamine-hydrolysing)
MCGIAGFALLGRVAGGSSLLHAMAEIIAHRGPDDEGFLEATADGGRYSIGLAHRRLSIIDLGAGRQPMSNEDGGIQIVFNGEIYNFASLRDELVARGHVFRTASDTETIVHAYEEYGDACVEHFRGMFAFALWDSRRERLLLARDRFGKKPLYLYERDGTLLFGSEIKSLLCYEGITPRVDLTAVHDYLAYRYVPGPRTLFAGISKLQPGCCAVWEQGELRQWNWYMPSDCVAAAGIGLPDDPVGDFLDKLDEAVRIRMVSDVPFGAFLSGGIDSSAVVGLMSRHSEFPVKTFSVGFAESAYSELAYAAAIARQFGTDHHELTVSQDHLMDELPMLVRFRDAPVAEPSDIPIYMLSKEARKTVKMVLTGEGSDEFLGGYPKHVFERYAACYQLLPGVLRSGLLESLVQALPYRFRRVKTAVVTMGLEDWQERMVHWFGALSQKERDAVVALRPEAGATHSPVAPKPDAGNTALRRMLCFDQTSWLPDNLLERGDRMTMAASIEARMPFMDHELAAFVSALPDNMRVRGRTTKWILREAMKRVLPAAILERPKVGFRVPVNEWFRGKMRDYLFDHLLGNDSRTCAYYNRPALEKILSDHVGGRQNHEKLLWCLLNLEIWHREYGFSA